LRVKRIFLGDGGCREKICPYMYDAVSGSSYTNIGKIVITENAPDFLQISDFAAINWNEKAVNLVIEPL